MKKIMYSLIKMFFPSQYSYELDLLKKMRYYEKILAFLSYIFFCSLW